MKKPVRANRDPAARIGWSAVLGLPTFRHGGRRLLRAARRFRPRRRPQPRTALSRQGLAALTFLAIVYVAALLGQVNLLLMLGGMLLGVLWVNWRLVAKTLRGLDVRRRIPRTVGAGDVLSVGLEIDNSRRRGASWALVVREEIRRAGDGGSDEPLRPHLFIPYVPGRQARAVVYRARFPRRGRYQFAPPAVSTRFPFGFFRRTVILGQDDTLLVLPRLGKLLPRWLARHHESFEGDRRHERRYGRIYGEFYGVRPWRSGDSRRHIHWRSSARHGTLVVRQFEQHRNRDVALVIELWQPQRPAGEDLENVELAVSFAATVVADTCRREGGNLWVGTTVAGEDLLRGPASSALMQEVMEKLAVAEASCEDRLVELLGRALAAIEPGTEVVLVTTRPVDLADPRFAPLSGNPAWRAIAPRVRVVNAAAADLADYFQPQ